MRQSLEYFPSIENELAMIDAFFEDALELSVGTGKQKARYDAFTAAREEERKRRIVRGNSSSYPRSA